MYASWRRRPRRRCRAALYAAPRSARVVDALPHVVRADALLRGRADVVEAERAERVVLQVRVRLLARAGRPERLLEVGPGARLPRLYCIIMRWWRWMCVVWFGIV